MKHARLRMQAYIALLLAALGGGATESAQTAHHADPASKMAIPAPLTERELSILRLMAAGLSNQAIGAELFLSVNTVRWYASQIFAELEANGHVAAVASGRKSGLL